ncbi:unnamed protein product [Caenorhabditis sp. 36 PRJEB53466]|nr:unnamed protein product [Caenorhabditis sp. 36 PRJEB53466]
MFTCETTDKPELIISSLGSTYITSLVVHTCDKVTVLNGSFAGVVLVERLSFIAIGRLYFEPYAFKDILQSPRQLVIDECTIPSLAPVAFAGLSHIDHLWFRNSRIDVIATESFHHLTNIDYIYFHRTKIGRIERRAFSKMYQIDHLYFKDAVEIGTIESEAFAGSRVDEFIWDGVRVHSAHATFLLNFDAEDTILKNSSLFLVPGIRIEEQQKLIERCLVEACNFNIMSPYEMGCVVLEVTSSTIRRIGPVTEDKDPPAVYSPDPSISTSLNSILFSNCTIGSIDSAAFTNYSLSILSFNHSTIGSLQPKSIHRSRIDRLGFQGSVLKVIASSAVRSSRITQFDVDSMEIDEIGSACIDSSTIGKLRILSSKISRMNESVFKDSELKECRMDGTRVLRMHSEAFYGNNQIASLIVTANDLSTSSSSPSLISPSAHPTSFLLANNTLDCSPTDCSTNSFLLNSPKHSPLLYQISSNRCRPPLQNPCTTARNVNLEDVGLTCRVSGIVADCACSSAHASVPISLALDFNVSIVIIGDCEQLRIDQTDQSFSQIYVFRTSQLMVHRLPSSLKVLKIFHSTVSLLKPLFGPKVGGAQDWQISHSKIDRFGRHSLANLHLSHLKLQYTRVPFIPAHANWNSTIDTLIIENSYLESTARLFEISESLRMQNSIVFSSPRGLGTISSAQLQNNTLLECCSAYRNPEGLDTIEMDPRCDLFFYASRCFDEEQIGGRLSNHLPITSSTRRLRYLYILMLIIII